LPVDTLLGVAVRADLPRAVESLYTLKGRPADKAFALAFANVKQLFTFVQPSPKHLRLLEILVEHSFLPGPLTLILPGSKNLGLLRAEWEESVACRLPGPSPASELLGALPWPLALTSANYSGAGDPTSREELDHRFRESVPLHWPGEPPLAQPSTILSFLGERPQLIRPGAVEGSKLEELFELIS
jgi:L-threonylcarbamoyladenylate synthase